MQHGGIRALGELALLIDEGDDVHRPVGNHVQCFLVVSELNVQPVDALQVVLLLLQLEHVPHEELLQVLIGKVNAELLGLDLLHIGHLMSMRFCCKISIPDTGPDDYVAIYFIVKSLPIQNIRIDRGISVHK